MMSYRHLADVPSAKGKGAHPVESLESLSARPQECLEEARAAVSGGQKVERAG